MSVPPGDTPDGTGELKVVLLYQPIVCEEGRRLAKGPRTFQAQRASLRWRPQPKCWN